MGLGYAMWFVVSANGCMAAARFPAAGDMTQQTVVSRLDEKTTRAVIVQSTHGRQYLAQRVAELPEPNRSIVQLLLKYPSNGEHDYWWPRHGEAQYDGSTTDVLFNGRLVMKGEPKGRTFCCGMTLELFYKYLQQNPALASKVSAVDLEQFKADWFCHNIYSPGPQDALEASGCGKRLYDLNEALPGDFVQIWRNDKSGHSVIFVNWLLNREGKRSGLQYWSTQPATKGIGFSSEIFGSAPKQINEQYISVSRPGL